MISLLRRSSLKKPKAPRNEVGRGAQGGAILSGLYAQSGSRNAWWPLEGDLTLVDSIASEVPPEQGGIFLSFSPDEDLSRPVDRTYRATVGEMITDLGEELFSFKQQASKASSADVKLAKSLRQAHVYATSKSRIEALPNNIQLVPGVAALRGLLACSNKLGAIEAPFVTGVLFEGRDSDVQVLILAVCQEDGGIDQFDYIPLSGLDPVSAIRSYVQSVRLSSSGEWTQERTAIFPASALLSSENSLLTYPKESIHFGLPESKIWKMGMALSIMALTTLSAASAFAYFANQTKIQEIQASKIATKKVLEETEKAISGPYLSSVLDKRTIDYESAIEKARLVWTPGATVAIKATKDLLLLTVTHKVQAANQVPEALANALNIPAPPGCDRLTPETSQQITELYLSYECKTSDSDLQRLQSISR